MIPSVSKALNDINDLARRSAAERETTAKREIANAEKFWSVWNDEVKAAKLGAFARRAKEITAISNELKSGRLPAAEDNLLVAVMYVSAIRKLSGKHFSL